MQKLSTQNRLKREISWHKHPFAVPIITLLALILLSLTGLFLFGGNIIEPTDTKLVNLSIDGERRTLPTRANSVRDFLQANNIELKQEDLVEPAIDSPLNADKFNINIYRAKPITFVDEGGHRTQAKVAPSDPVYMAKAAGITVFPEDKITQAPVTEVLNDNVLGHKIIIDRAVPVKLNLFGVTYDIRTHAATVAELAAERAIPIEQSSVLPSPETPIKANDLIIIVEKGKKIVTLEESIPQAVEYVDSVDLAKGTNQTREEGSPGKKVVIYEIASDGKKKPIREVIIANPQRKLVARGTKADPAKTFAGNFDAALARLRSCEGSYTSNTGNGYYGAYQFDIRTWNNFGGYPNAAAAPPIVQDQKAWETYQRRGWQPWPSCSIKLGLQDIYR